MDAPALSPQSCRARREALGWTLDQAARRTGLTTEALERFEAGGGGLSDEQRAVLRRVIGTPPPPAPTSGRPWPLLDLGLPGAIAFFIGGALPLAMAVVTGAHALRFLGAETVQARVIGFEAHERLVRPDSGPDYRVTLQAPLLRFLRPDGGGEVTIPWRETQPEEPEFAIGDRLRLIVPPGAPELAETSYADIMLRPMLGLALAAPLLMMGAVSLGHWRRRRRQAA